MSDKTPELYTIQDPKGDIHLNVLEISESWAWQVAFKLKDYALNRRDVEEVKKVESLKKQGYKAVKLLKPSDQQSGEYIEIAKLEEWCARKDNLGNWRGNYEHADKLLNFAKSHAVKLPEVQDSENDETQRRIGFTTAVKYIYELRERYPNQKLDKIQVLINFVREGSKWVNTPPQEGEDEN